MADDDGDNLKGPTTDPLDAVEGGFRSNTVPLPMAQSSDEIPTNPRHAIDDSVDFDAVRTGKMEASRSHDELAQPDDETGYIDARGLGIAPEGATNKLPATTVMADLRDPPTLRGDDDYDEDPTNIGGVSDDAIVRRVVLPDVPQQPAPPPIRQPVADPTRPSQLMPPPSSDSLQPPAPMRAPAPVQVPAPAQPPAKPANSSKLVKPWRAPSGFWRNRPPTKESTVARAPIDPADLEARHKRAFLIAGGLCVVWLITIFGLAVASWMDPADVALLGILAVLPTALVVGGLSRPEGRPPGIEDVRILVKPLAVALGVMIVLPLPWQVGVVRRALRSMAGGSPDIVVKVLADRSDTVALAECQRVLAAFPREGVVEILAAGLPGRAEVARQCVAGSGEVAPLVSRKLVEVWGAGLLDKRTAPETACKIAESMPSLQRPAGEVETRLLSCVMSAAPEVRVCCGDALINTSDGGSPDWVAKIEAEPSYVPDEPTAASLLALTFGSPEVSEAQKEIVARAGFKGAAAQRMALVFGCAASKAGANLGDEFVASLGQCPIDADTIPRDRQSWVAVCDQSSDRIIRRRQDPQQSLCLALMEIAGELAQKEATAGVVEAVRQARNKRR